MSNQTFRHKNMESDTVHGHNTHLAEMNMHNIIVEKENHPKQSVNSNKLCEEYEKREIQKEKENIVRRAEYRDYLLKQMSDKVGKNCHSEEISSMTPFSEETLDASEKMNLKLQKQKEVKQNLDDCIKMKQDMKIKTQRTEREEEQVRTDFWKKREDYTIHTLEKAKQKSEMKENKKNEVALLWMAEKRKDVQRDKFIDGLIEKESIFDLKHQKELIETQESIRMKKELYKENEEKIKEWLKNLELVKKEQEQLQTDIEREEELEQKLIQDSLIKKTTPGSDEVDQTKKVLQERNYQCANNRFFGIEC